jgi:hypothetical protein
LPLAFSFGRGADNSSSLSGATMRNMVVSGGEAQSTFKIFVGIVSFRSAISVMVRKEAG